MDRGPAKKRDRSGRKAKTATKTRRQAVETMRAERKEARQKSRIAAKRAAAATPAEA